MRKPLFPSTDLPRGHRWLAAGGAALILLLLLARAWAPVAHHPGTSPVDRSAGPPWVYGKADAPFTVIEYADLECPYCKAYFPILQRWIQQHPEVNWQWRHLPLAMHEPATMQEARLAECAGEAEGAPAFWRTVAWIYQHTASDGQGLPTGTLPPHMTPPTTTCLASTRPDAVIHAQVQEAAREGIDATPTLQLLDHRNGRALTLHGPVDGDALLSALDWLVSPPPASTPLVRTSSMPASGIPR